ncbi:MAG: hypothetical protein GY714_10670 [Desulfobacterales bacterium]|nr:hypothetical protein [Desulfobacterales bacterium]
MMKTNNGMSFETTNGSVRLYVYKNNAFDMEAVEQAAFNLLKSVKQDIPLLVDSLLKIQKMEDCEERQMLIENVEKRVKLLL